MQRRGGYGESGCNITIGVDGDQVMAAVNATLKMLNLLMLQNQVQAEPAA